MCDLTNPARYAGYLFPTTVIHHALWLMNRFNLSLRTVQEMLLERGIQISHETLREWNLKFTNSIAFEIKRYRATPGKTCLDHNMHLAGMVAGIWMRCASKFRGRSSGYGEPWINTARC